MQSIQQSIAAVFAAREASHDVIARFSHIEIVDGIVNCEMQVFIEFILFEFVMCFFRHNNARDAN